MTDEPAGDNPVAPEDACPLCGERDADRLTWLDDDRVRCMVCGTEYRPTALGHDPSQN